MEISEKIRQITKGKIMEIYDTDIQKKVTFLKHR